MSVRQAVRIIRHLALSPEEVAACLSSHGVPVTYTQFSTFPAAYAGKRWRTFRKNVVEGSPHWMPSSLFYV